MGGETAWSIRLFGEIRVAYNGTDTPVFSNRKVAQLLLLLASQPSKALSRDSIAETLWPGEYLEIAKDRLRQTLSLLNKHFRDAGGESPIEATKTTIALRSDCEVDYQKAPNIDLSGTFAEGFVEDWIRELRDSITAEVVQAFRTAADQASSPEDALKSTDVGLRLSPLDEALAVRRLTTLQDLGRDAEAHQFAQSYEQRLRSQLGLAPGSAWQVAKQSQQTRDETPSVESSWLGLAQSVDRFFGRTTELEALAENFAGKSPTRLLTITGQGGSGKTRLIVEFLNRPEASRFNRRIVLGLAERETVSQIETDLAEALDVVLPSSGDLGKNLSAFLTEGQTLLVLDNCEHLMPDIAADVKSLLHFCPNISILATSRIKLGIHGERELVLDPLGLPDEDHEITTSPAVQLLVDRIQSTDHTYEPDAEELNELARLSRILEGVPLALELAASQMAVLSVRELRERLEGRIVDLANANKDLPARHLALRNTLSWGYERLELDRQRAICKLSLFNGPWTIEDAQAILNTDDVVAIHEDLKRVAMIAIQAGTKPRRFRMLDMVRQFVGPLLTDAETDETLTRHFHHYVAKIVKLYERRVEADQVPVIREFRNDLPHCRLVIHTGMPRPELSQELTTFIRRSAMFAEASGLSQEWMQATKALIDRGGLNKEQEGFLWAYYSHSQAYHGDVSAIDMCVAKLEVLVENETDFILRRYMANQLSSIIVCGHRKDLAEKYIPIVIKCNDSDLNDEQRAMGYHGVGNMNLLLRRFDVAEEFFHKGLAIAEDLGRPRPILWLNFHLSYMDFLQENHSLALDRIHGIFDVLRRSSDHVLLVAYIRNLVSSLSCIDQSGRWASECALLIGFSEMRRRQYAIRLDEDDTGVLNRALSNLRPVLGTEFDSQFEAGAKLSIEEAFDRCEAVFQSIS